MLAVAALSTFKRGLKTMGKLYGSLWLTTVIQVKDVVFGVQANGSPYNTRAYEDRGWCIFEEGAASLAAHHRLRSLAAPASRKHTKLIDLSHGKTQKVDVASNVPDVHKLQKRIEAAHFTGKADRTEVIQMLKKYGTLLTVGGHGVMKKPGSIVRPTFKELEREEKEANEREDAIYDRLDPWSNEPNEPSEPVLLPLPAPAAAPPPPPQPPNL